MLWGVNMDITPRPIHNSGVKYSIYTRIIGVYFDYIHPWGKVGSVFVYHLLGRVYTLFSLTVYLVGYVDVKYDAFSVCSLCFGYNRIRK